MMGKRVLIGMAGAPTVVVDAGLHACTSFIAGACEVQGVIGGPDGLVNGRYRPVESLDLKPFPRAGSTFFGGRRQMTSTDISQVLRNLEEHRIDTLVMAGGNGTMALLNAIAEAAEASGSTIQTVGIPKTIDNDLLGVDFSPGFGSSARYLCSFVSDIARDHLSMSAMEPIRIVETMGRNVGWLAMAGAASSIVDDGTEVDLCLVPECGENEPHIFSNVDEALTQRSRAFIVCSEGFSFRDSEDDYEAANHHRLLRGGVARRLADALEAEFGRPARGEVIGTSQRSASNFASAADLDVAQRTGSQAGLYVLEGRSRVMVGTHRRSDLPLVTELLPVDLDAVSGDSKPLPPHLQPSRADHFEAFADWLAPIVSSGI